MTSLNKPILFWKSVQVIEQKHKSNYNSLHFLIYLLHILRSISTDFSLLQEWWINSSVWNLFIIPEENSIQKNLFIIPEEDWSQSKSIEEYEVNKLKNEDGYSCFYAFVQ